MGDQELMTCIKEILRDYSEVPLSEIPEDSDLFADLALNSLDVVNIAVAFEERFGIEIPDDDLVKFRTMGDIREYLKHKILVCGGDGNVYPLKITKTDL